MRTICKCNVFKLQSCRQLNALENEHSCLEMHNRLAWLFIEHRIRDDQLMLQALADAQAAGARIQSPQSEGKGLEA